MAPRDPPPPQCSIRLIRGEGAGRRQPVGVRGASVCGGKWVAGDRAQVLALFRLPLRVNFQYEGGDAGAGAGAGRDASASVSQRVTRPHTRRTRFSGQCGICMFLKQARSPRRQLNGVCGIVKMTFSCCTHTLCYYGLIRRWCRASGTAVSYPPYAGPPGESTPQRAPPWSDGAL